MGRLVITLRQWWTDLFGALFPRRCAACGATLVKGERVICLSCNASMPRVGMHSLDFSIIHERVMGHAPIDRAASYFYYSAQSPYARIIHQAKYSGLWSIARDMGALMAEELAADGFFDGIDSIVPVPISPAKQRKRGYNQSLMIARGISGVTGIRVDDILIARDHDTQTRRGAYERWLNTRNVYAVALAADLADQHILLVDDIITTGATILACAEAIHAAFPSARISIASLGLTARR